MVNREEPSGIRKGKVDLSVLGSVLPEDHRNKVILRACERLELAFNDRNKYYTVKVEVLLSVLECLLSECLVMVSPETISLLFDYLLQYTLSLVLHAHWGENKAVKLHMVSLFKRYRIRAEKKQLVRVVREIEYLLQLIDGNPWRNVALVKILSGETANCEELLEFVKSELGVFLNVRLEVLVYAQCNIQAMSLIEKCLNCISTPSNREYFQHFPDEVTYLRDFYLLMLNKAKSDNCVSRKILNEVNQMGMKECLRFIKRCQNKELPFEILSRKSANVVVNMALASALIKNDTDDETLQEIVQLWFDTLTDNHVLLRLLKHMVINAVCSRYIYILVEKLIERVKLNGKELCVEVFVRGLTLNVNEIERFQVNEDQITVNHLKKQLSNGFLKLAEYLEKDVLIHRECLLSALSLVPSQSILERIKFLGENSYKVIAEERIKVEEKPLPLVDQNKTVQTLEDPMTGVEELTQMVCDNLSVESSCEKTLNVPPNEELVHDPVSSLTQLGKHSLEDEVDLGSDHDKENNRENKNKLKRTQCLQIFEAEALGISQTLCDDLATLVCNLKNQDFQWDLEWPEIIQKCEMYIFQSESNKNTNKFYYNSHNGERVESFSERYGSDHMYNLGVQTPIKSSKRKRKKIHYN